MKTICLYLLLVTCLSGCTLNGISVHTDYLSHQNLASYHVNTPDPMLNDPPVGQRLIATWALPKHYLSYEDLHLLITIRFRTREQIIEKVPIYKMTGTFVYTLLNEDYFSKGGILTYKAELIGNHAILEEWKHQMWTRLITFADESVNRPYPQIDELLSPETEEEKEEERDPNYEFEETTLPQEFRLSSFFLKRILKNDVS